MRPLKIFVVGPHNKNRYDAIRNYVMAFAARQVPQVEVAVVTPTDNPAADRFNDWIFGQIDTCDLLIADLTGFNANVVYEVAFAHTLGTPCLYLQFGQSAAETRKTEDIKHYFKFSLMNQTDEDGLYAYLDPSSLEGGRVGVLDDHLTRFFSGNALSGETILSDYYGSFPADAEFMRGLADGYFRNFLGFILEAKPPDEHKNMKLRVVIPDTFEVSDGEISRIKEMNIGTNYTIFPNAENSMGRKFGVTRSDQHKDDFFFDIPTTILTVTSCSKYQKIQDTKYFSELDRDALTDKLARKFVESIWQRIRDNRRSIKFPTSQLEFIWLSDLVPDWHPTEALLNDVPFERPTGF